MIKKFITLIFFLFFLVLFSIFVIKNNLLGFSLKQIPKIEKSITDNLIDIEKKIYTPSPIVSKEGAPNSFLTKEGVLQWTNVHRNETESLPAVLQNIKLDTIATKRLENMFEKQYFDHISPSGAGVSDVAKNIGYEFISIGENIALGNFKDDKTLVQAWMDSPGHRANILNNGYTEIGIAVKKDLYEELETWIGVQIFARPLSDCPQADQSLKAEIEKIQSQIENLENLSSALRKEIENINPTNKKNIKIYNRRIDEYNSIIKEINSFAKAQKNLILKYNNQVDALNKCIQR